MLLLLRRMLLVQAVSQHRQRRPGDAVVSLLNLVSTYRAQPEAAAEGGSVGVVQWGEREELKDLYGIYCRKVGEAGEGGWGWGGRWFTWIINPGWAPRV